MKVNFYATLRQVVGAKTVEIPLPQGATAASLLQAIIDSYPGLQRELIDKNGKMYGHVHLFVNGRDVQFLEDGFETVLEPDDKISVFPAVGGG